MSEGEAKPPWEAVQALEASSKDLSRHSSHLQVQFVFLCLTLRDTTLAGPPECEDPRATSRGLAHIRHNTFASVWLCRVQALWLDSAANQRAQRLAEECKVVIRRMLVRPAQLLRMICLMPSKALLCNVPMHVEACTPLQCRSTSVAGK